MTWEERIDINPGVLVGKPVIRGTRLAFEFIVGLVARGWSERQIIENYDITHEDIEACQKYAHGNARRGVKQDVSDRTSALGRLAI